MHFIQLIHIITKTMNLSNHNIMTETLQSCYSPQVFAINSEEQNKIIRTTRKTKLKASMQILIQSPPSNNHQRNPTKNNQIILQQKQIKSASSNKYERTTRQRKQIITDIPSIKLDSPSDQNIIDNSKNDYDTQTKKKINEQSPSPEDQHSFSIPMIHFDKKRSLLDATSPYLEHRKSYRKSMVRKEILSIPYRRNQDPFQCKIVNILNKLIHGKPCTKQFSHLTEKMLKLNSRQLRNKYIISGFKAIVYLAQNNQNLQQSLIQKLKNTDHKLNSLIETQLNNNQDYIEITTQQEIMDGITLNNFLVRKIYSILKQFNRKNITKISLKQQAVKISQNFMQKQLKYKKDVIKLLQSVRQLCL